MRLPRGGAYASPPSGCRCVRYWQRRMSRTSATLNGFWLYWCERVPVMAGARTRPSAAAFVELSCL